MSTLSPPGAGEGTRSYRGAVSESGPSGASQSGASQRPMRLEQIQIPGYEILSVLGRGGMGIVYQARQVKLGRLVALKMILAGEHASDQELLRFRTEAEAIARLQHPHIVQVFEVNDLAGMPFFSLEFCPGGNLARSIDGTPLAPAAAAALVEKLARAVAAAHDAKVVHRDLKPTNVLLSATGEPKISDFGLAKKLDDVGQTQSGAVMGTPSYMAPEQAQGKSQDVGPAADIYALGAILYELLTGRSPFKGATTVETLFQVIHHEPVPPSRLQPSVPRDLETICLTCLQKAPAARYASAAALADDLQRFQKGEPITARPVSALGRAWRWCRRNRAVAALLAGVVVSLLGGISAATYFAVEANIRASETLQETLRANKTTEEAKDNAAKAKHNADLAREEQKRAEANETEAKRNVYVTSLNLAAQALEAGDVEECRRLLQAVVPKNDEADLRGFEWHYLRRQAHLPHDELGPRKGHVRAVVVTPDGRTLIVAGGTEGQGEVSLWDLAARKEVATLTGFKSAVNAVALSRDGQRLATAEGAYERPGAIKIWDLRERKLIKAFGDGSDAFTSLAFMPDGKTLAAGTARFIRSFGSPGDRFFHVKNETRPGGVRLWDSNTSQELAVLPGETGHVFAVAISPKGDWIAAGNSAGAVTVWNAATRQAVATLRGGFGRVWATAFSPDGRILAATGGSWEEPGQIKLWQMPATPGGEFREDWTLHVAHGGAVALAFTPDGKQLASAGWDRTVRCWDLATGMELAAAAGHLGYVWSLAFTPNGQTLISGGWGYQRSLGEIKVWNTSVLPRIVLTTNFGTAGTYQTSARNGKLVAVHLKDSKKMVLVDAETGKQRVELQGPVHGLRCVAFSPDGRYVATCTFAEHITRLWSAETGAAIAAMQVGSSPFLTFAPDSKTLATAGDDGIVRLWDVPMGVERLALKGHTDVIWSLSFTPDGRRLASGSWDRTAKVWDTSRGTLLATLKGHKEVVWKVHFINNGYTLTTCTDHSRDHLAVGVWDGRSPTEPAGAPSASADREDVEGYVYAGFAYLALGRDGEAEEAYRRAEALRSKIGPLQTHIARGSLAKLHLHLKYYPSYIVVVDIKDRLLPTDPKDAVRTASPHRVHTAKLQAGRTYMIELRSGKFDAYLRVEDSNGARLDEDDDAGGGTDSMVLFSPPKNGVYRLIATTYDSGSGDYNLRVREVQERKRK